MASRPLSVALAVLVCACVERGPEASGSSTGDTDTGSASGDGTDSTGGPTPTSTGMSEETGTGISTGTDATSEPGDTTGFAGCEPYSIDLLFEVPAPRVVLLLDRSPAMLDPWDHDLDAGTPDEPRWASVRRTLLAHVPADLGLALGLGSYPGADADDVDGACLVTPALFEPPGAVSLASLAAGLPPELPPQGTFVGGAPLRAGIDAAVELLGPGADVARHIVVIGNSAANCSEGPPDLESFDEGVFAAAEAAAAAGVVVTFVPVGSPASGNPVALDGRPDGVSPLASMKQIAALGLGGAFKADHEGELAAVISGIFTVGGDTSCQVALDPVPTPEHVIVDVRTDDVSFPAIDDCAVETGWRRVDLATIELCGGACSQFLASGMLTVELACQVE